MEQHDDIKQIRTVVDAIFAQQQRERLIIRAEIDALPPQATLMAEKLYEGCVSPRYAADYLAAFASAANVAAELAAITRASDRTTLASAKAHDMKLGLILLKGALSAQRLDDFDEWGKR